MKVCPYSEDTECSRESPCPDTCPERLEDMESVKQDALYDIAAERNARVEKDIKELWG